MCIRDREFAAELPQERAKAPDASAAAKASAIVVSYNTGEVLFDCLAALERDPAISEIVLVNNGNPVEILERVEDGYGRSGRVKIIGGGDVSRPGLAEDGEPWLREHQSQ